MNRYCQYMNAMKQIMKLSSLLLTIEHDKTELFMNFLDNLEVLSGHECFIKGV